MRASILRGRIRRAVQKWARAEIKRSRGIRAKPEVILRFLPTKKANPRVTAEISLYHKSRNKEPVRIKIQTTNSFGELVLTLETILDEWKDLSDYA